MRDRQKERKYALAALLARARAMDASLFALSLSLFSLFAALTARAWAARACFARLASSSVRVILSEVCGGRGVLFVCVGSGSDGQVRGQPRVEFYLVFLGRDVVGKLGLGVAARRVDLRHVVSRFVFND